MARGRVVRHPFVGTSQTSRCNAVVCVATTWVAMVAWHGVVATNTFYMSNSCPGPTVVDLSAGYDTIVATPDAQVFALKLCRGESPGKCTLVITWLPTGVSPRHVPGPASVRAVRSKHSMLGDHYRTGIIGHSRLYGFPDRGGSRPSDNLRGRFCSIWSPSRRLVGVTGTWGLPRRCCQLVCPLH